MARFRLITLLALVMYAAIWLAFHSNRARYEQVVEGEVLAAYGRVSFSWTDSERPQSRLSAAYERLLITLFGQRFIRRVEFSIWAPSACDLDRVLRLPHLRSLSLVNCEVGEHQLQSLHQATGLVDLDLTRSRVSDDELPGLSALTKLRTVDLAGTRVGDETLRQLARLPNLVLVKLNGTKVTGEGIQSIASRHSLVGFYADHSCLDDDFLAVLASCPKLESLCLARTKTISDDGMRPFQDHPNLQHVDLSGIPLTDTSLEALSGLPRLKLLLLDSNLTTEHARQSFRAKRPGVVAGLSKWRIPLPPRPSTASRQATDPAQDTQPRRAQR